MREPEIDTAAAPPADAAAPADAAGTVTAGGPGRATAGSGADARAGGGNRDAPPHAGLSLRLRLMLMLLAVFGVIQVSMSALGLMYVRRTADAVFDERLAERTDAIARRLDAARGVARPLTDPDLATLAGEEGRGIFLERAVLTVYGPGGEQVASSGRPALPFVPPAPPSDAGASPAKRVRNVAVPTDAGGKTTSGRAAAASFTAADGRPHVVVVGTSDAFVRYTSEQFSRHIVVATPIGLAAAAVAGWLIAGVAVRPLRRLSQIASGLRPDTLQDPIDIGSTAAELTKLQEDLDRMRRRLETGYEAQERFVANVSHEIKTPIATVLTEAQTLPKRLDLPPEVRRFLESTQDEMRRLGRLVESFLLLTRVRHGKRVESTARSIAVNDLVMDSLMHCWKMAEQYGLRLAPELAVEDDDRELAVTGDPELLRTMVDNLVRNAIRFSPKGELVELAVRPGKADVSICVRDRGPGIPDEYIDKIFDRFSQAKSEEKLGRGSGLGLEIAQGIAELHGGKIAVGNRPGGGCEFCASLPLPGRATNGHEVTQHGARPAGV